MSSIMRWRNGLMVESVMAVLLFCGEVQDLTSSRQRAAVTTLAVTTANVSVRRGMTSGRKYVRY